MKVLVFFFVLFLVSCQPAKKENNGFTATFSKNGSGMASNQILEEQQILLANSTDYSAGYVLPEGLTGSSGGSSDEKIGLFERKRKELQDELFLSSTNAALLGKIAKAYGKPFHETRKTVQNAYSPDQNDELIEMDFGKIVYSMYRVKSKPEQIFIVSITVKSPVGKKLLDSILSMKLEDLEAVFGKTLYDRLDSFYLSSLNPEFFDDELRASLKDGKVEKIVYTASL